MLKTKFKDLYYIYNFLKKCLIWLVQKYACQDLSLEQGIPSIHFLADNFLDAHSINQNHLDPRSTSSPDKIARARTWHLFAQRSTGFLVCSQAPDFGGSVIDEKNLEWKLS